ncbi:hypothetical protein DL96DRAFT_1613301 [Flagelloscypha sp. PMI_526]|nr:hypothetical protein DL96DRAFT_1613301 [Flagelloscypha sp. PMI_526]
MATLFVTQKLFMHRLLVKHQSLTQSHDQHSSWLGLASAVTALFKQRSARAGYKWILLITTYLAASAAMKITTAALFQLSPTTIIVPTETQAMSVTSDFLTSIMRGSTLGPQGDSMVQYLREAMVLEYARLGTWQGSPTVDSVGLQGNVLYDIIPSIANSTDKANVTSTTLNVDCQSISTEDFLNLTVPVDQFGPERQEGWDLTPLSVSKDIRERNGSQTVPPSFLIPIQLMYRIDDSQGKALNVTPFTKILIDNSTSHVYIDDPSAFAWVPETDSIVKCPQELYLDASVPFNTGPERAWVQNIAKDSGVGLMICSITWAAGSAIINTQQRTPIEVSKRKDQSSWSQIPLANLTLPKTGGASPIFNSLGEPPGRGQFDLNCRVTSAEMQSFSADWTYFDIFVDKYLGLTKQETPRLKLHEFENMLEDWIAMNLFIYSKANVILGSASSNVSTTVPVKTQVSELQLRALPVYAGFAASLIMLAIASTIVFTTPALRFHPNEIGVLQLLWLSDVRFDLGPDTHPTEVNLRKAGLATSVSLVNGVGVFRRATKPV